MKLSKEQVDELILDIEALGKNLVGLVDKWEQYFEDGQPVTENPEDAKKLEEARERFEDLLEERTSNL